MFFGTLMWLPLKVIGHVFRPVTSMVDDLANIEELW